MTGSHTIDETLARGAIIITGNARAARRLQLDYGRRQRTLGHIAWPTPPIFDWRTWLNDLWQQWGFQHPDAPVLLTPMQESALWKTALGDDAHSVVSPDSLAALAQQAYSLLCEYEAHSTRNEMWDSPDAERFRHWASKFERNCTTHSWLSPSRIEERLTAAARSGELTHPAALYLTGFDRFTPAQESFLDALKACGTIVEVHHADLPQAPVRALGAVSERAEIETCAQWLRQQLETSPESHFAVLCTDIEQRRGEIDRIFRRILTPEIEESPDALSPRHVYEFTLGTPLATIPAIRAALLALQWLMEPIPQENLSTLLLSGYLAGSEEELLACALVDAVLRERVRLTPFISISNATESSGTRASMPEGLRKRLRAALTYAAQNHFEEEQRIPSAWVELFRSVLEAAGWPGFRTADSVQFQAQRRWDKLFDDLALLDAVTKPTSCGRFLNLLTLHAQQTLFTPESLDAPIQIMGPMESAGQHFDAIWFLGATDERWPSTGRPHPLIPMHIQRDAGMPHADANSDLDLAHKVTRRIQSIAARITFSRALHNKNGELRPSSIVSSLATEDIVPDTVTLPPNPETFLESWQESEHIPFPGGAITGGSALLRDQAACPFRSFAAHRLQAEKIPEAEWGLTAKDRGILLHDILRRFWSQTEPRCIASRDDLIRVIADGTLQTTLEHHIDASFHENLPQDAAVPWLIAYLDVEKRRLASLLTTWLTQESQRQPFTVESREERLPGVTVGSLQLNLQADRIDLLQDGSRLLIDYKTGQVKAAAWQGERPDEPQLPLYAVYGKVDNLSGALFAQIRKDESKFIGHVRDARGQLLADLKDTSPLVKFPYSDSMHDQWLTALDALAQEFAGGEARIQPKHGEKTCQYCPLPGLCRIHEINASAEHSLWENSDSNDEEQESEDA